MEKTTDTCTIFACQSRGWAQDFNDWGIDEASEEEKADPRYQVVDLAIN